MVRTARWPRPYLGPGSEVHQRSPAVLNSSAGEGPSETISRCLLQLSLVESTALIYFVMSLSLSAESVLYIIFILCLYLLDSVNLNSC